MDDLIEIILDLIIDGSIELLPNKKIPKWIRIITSIIFISIIIAIVVLGIIFFRESILIGTILLVVGVVLLLGSIIKIRKYMKS